MIASSLDVFGGAGGMGEAIAQALSKSGTSRSIDSDQHATDTANARGLLARVGDARTLQVTPGRWEHHHYSPPCTTIAQAGDKRGAEYVPAIAAMVQRVMDGQPVEDAVPGADRTTLLMLQPARLIRQGAPQVITMEQVKGALPVWEAYAVALYARGYQCWTGLLHGEQYGLPQTRTRAWLMARYGFHRMPVQPPAPTHSRYYPRDPGRLDPGVKPWVSMATALLERHGDGVPSRQELPGWAYCRPSTTVVGSFRPEVQAAPGWRKAGDPSRQNVPDSVVTTVAEAARLQGFRPGPWCGPESSVRRQIGNAVPPPVGLAVLRALL